MGNEYKIVFDNVYKSFGANQVLRGFSLSIQKGETLVILGRSGCGKSVSLKILLGLLHPDSGHVYIDDIQITALAEKEMFSVRQKTGILFQGSALFDSMTVGENIGFPLSEHTKMTEEEIEKAVETNLEFVDMAGTQSLIPSELSGGMKKRVALARAMIYQPEIMLYDEPTTGLDPITATTINALIRKTRSKYGVTSIVVTHELESAYSVADRLAVIHEGRIIEIGPKDVIINSQNEFVMNFLAGPK
ncbi:MAG: ABC transporter ATP-binding protein [candidate division KSB1 bacterium]|nr:ABC transporter ATP-binding protein [candidate division KSB1 bacterium]